MKIAELYALYQHSKGISIDSRTIEGGQLFFAIKGEHFNGNKYAPHALKKGAVGAVVDDPTVKLLPNMVYVDDALGALQEMARYHRKLFAGTIIAITGSNGKTTSKELTHAILSTEYKAFATTGNLNNHIGTPLTLLSMPVDLDFAVIEFGDNRPGEISMLSSITMPDYGVVTNVGKDHLEGFGDWQGVYNARKELFDHLRKYGKPAFVNTDLPYLLDMAQDIAETITYGAGCKVQYRYRMEKSGPYVQMTMFHDDNPITIQSQLFGSYNFQNMMLAATIGKYFQVPTEKIKLAIETYRPKNNRSQIIKWRGNHVLMDAYNANPSNVEAALDSFAGLKADRKMVILGDMLELGAHTETEHKRLAHHAMSKDFDKVILVGRNFKAVAREDELTHFEDVDTLKKWLKKNLPTGYWILVKGSRKISLEKLID